jgi:hypothetical protein
MKIGPSRVGGVVLVFALCGCYMPSPADPGTLSSGDDIRVALSRAGRAELNGTPLNDGDQLRGTLVRLTADSLTIGMRLAVSGPVLLRSDVRQPVTIARADIEEVTVPRLDRRKTGLVVGGLLLTAAILIGDLFDIRGGGSSGPPPNPPDPGAPFTIRR